MTYRTLHRFWGAAGALLLAALLAFAFNSAFGQTTQNVSISVGNGTLSYQYEVQQGNCEGTQTSANMWQSFTYTPSGGSAIPLSGSINYIYPCTAYNINGGWDYVTNDYSSDDWSNELDFTNYVMIGDQSCQVVFYADEGDADGSGSLSCYNPGIVYPQYKVMSIIYDAPGNESQNGYGTSTTDGSQTSIGSNFESGTSTTYTSGPNFFGLGATLSVTFNTSGTIGDSSAYTETFTQGSGVSNASSSSSPNAINHDQDLFLIWLNPAVSMLPDDSNGGISYSLGTQNDPNGDPGPVDIVEVYANEMEANASGDSTVPLQWLTPQYDSATQQYDLPGLSEVCANPLPPSECTQANQCGCRPADFANILARDPLLSYGSTESPLNADGSGATACGELPTPATDLDCRYLPVPAQSGSDIQLTESLVGPSCTGCNAPGNSFSLTDSNMATQTYSTSFSWGVSYSWKAGVGNIASWSAGNSFEWTNSESSGAINGHANSMSDTLKSSTVDCVQQIPIFYDTVYHTFVFQQPSGDSSCP